MSRIEDIKDILNEIRTKDVWVPQVTPEMRDWFMRLESVVDAELGVPADDPQQGKLFSDFHLTRFNSTV